MDGTREVSSLLQAGRPADAAGALRRMLDHDPDSHTTASAMAQVAATARTWLTRGQIDQAIVLLAPIAASTGASSAVLMLYGHALMAQGRKSEAEGIFRRWRSVDPASRDAVLRLAAVLADNGNPGEAEALVRFEVARSGSSPEAAFVLGRALLELARFDEAETEFRKVVAVSPEHQLAQSNLMELVWMRTGNVQAASRAIDKVLRGQPNLPGLRIAKARLLTSAQLPREALAEVESGIAASAGDAALLAAAATLALEIDGDRAMHYARRLLALLPNDRAARVGFGNAALATGQALLALETADALHQSDPHDGRALAMRGDALRMLGDPRWRELHDYAHFVRAELIDVPDGWKSRQAYVEQLIDELESVHTLKAHPIGNSLRGGSQVQLVPHESPLAAIKAFPSAIDGPINRYMQSLGAGTDPMRIRNTGRYQISGMWSVRLRPDGFHANHYHPEGWMSSACYLRLPSAVRQRGGAGWLKFGEPDFPMRPSLEPEYLIKPEPGLLALFPAYLWHGTVPFSGPPDETRLTIAFDVLPA